MSAVLTKIRASQGKGSIATSVAADGMPWFLKRRYDDTLAQDDPIHCYSLLYRHAQTRRLEWRCKRLFDIVVSALGLVVLFPVFVLIALSIRLESPGPVLFTQERIGYRRRPFNMYKFRSMYVDAEERLRLLWTQNESSVMFKMKQDPRMTRVGKLLRRFSLDEFPQLLNVLRGDMSLVGPRPPIERELRHYKRWHYVRFATLPGMTGLWQVIGRSEITDFDEVVSLDAHYIEHWHIGLDLALIARTIPAVLSAKGSY
jgi:lipopolysaccharide/colanic/teichoic acid biosynthesis glycosyltransferase